MVLCPCQFHYPNGRSQGYSPYVVAEMAGNSPMVIYKHYYKNTKADEMLKEMNSIFGE